MTQYRGNVTRAVSLAGTTYGCFDETGTAKTSQAVTGTQTNVQTSSNSSYAVPTAITQGSLSETMNWNSFLGMTGATNPNGATTSVSYDSATRPSVVTNPHGGSTTYTYTNSPPTVTATVNTTGDGNGRWTRTTLDGLGRTIKVETGYSTVTKSIAETEYDSCACSPTGKLKRSTMPYAPGGTKWWKTNTYDALGRTVSVQEADHASTTTYVYEGVTVKVTDPAGKWKKFFMNGLGQLCGQIWGRPHRGARSAMAS